MDGEDNHRSVAVSIGRRDLLLGPVLSMKREAARVSSLRGFTSSSTSRYRLRHSSFLGIAWDARKFQSHREERRQGGCQRPQAAPKTLQNRIGASFSSRPWPWSRGSCKLALRRLAALGQLWLAVPLPWPHRNLGFRRRFFLRERRCGGRGIALQRERGGWRGL